MLTKSDRYSIVVAAVSLMLTGCGDASSTLGPSAPSGPARPTAPRAEVSTLPAWPALPHGAEVYYQTNDLYGFFTPYLGAMQSRYVLYDAERFGLQFISEAWGNFEYTGRFERHSDSTLMFFFDGWSVMGPWIATGTLHETHLTVAYNDVMLWSDFFDGTYARVAGPHE